TTCIKRRWTWRRRARGTGWRIKRRSGKWRRRRGPVTRSCSTSSTARRDGFAGRRPLILHPHHFLDRPPRGGALLLVARGVFLALLLVGALPVGPQLFRLRPQQR